MNNVSSVELMDALTRELRPTCHKCKQSGYVDAQGFGNTKIRAVCSICRGKGTLLLSADELTQYVEALRQIIRNRLG